MQLRPPVNSYELLQHKRLDVSCFERIILLGMMVPCLQNQSRMREDALLPVLQHYPKLRTNTERVRHLERLTWLPQSLFWWVCESPGVQKDSSWYNEEQGYRATQLASFLRTQDACDPSQITILVPYSSQQFFIRSLLRPLKLENVAVSTVDQYQGDENDNIILCLVRCNHECPEKLGFMSELNRMIVSTSRQRKSLIIIGSRICFATNKEWKKLQDALETPVAVAIHSPIDSSMETAGSVNICDREAECSTRIGDYIPIVCPRHSKALSVPDSSVGFPRSGCGEGCRSLLTCGHPCTLKCHPTSLDHGFCKVSIIDVFKDCGHDFKIDCGNLGTNSCQKIILCALPCGHKAPAKCSIWTRKRDSISCREHVTHTLLCGHTLVLLCGLNLDAYNDPTYCSCLSCQSNYLGGDSLNVMPTIIKRIVKEQASLTYSPLTSKRPNKTLWDWQVKEVFLALCRSKLCNVEDSEVIREVLINARVSESLFLSSLPPSSTWDHNLSESERFKNSQTFADEQSLWRVVLQESGFNIPKAWISQSLSLITCLAIFSFEGCVPNLEQSTNVEVFEKRLSMVKDMNLSSQGLISLIKHAGDDLYDALTKHSDSDHWYYAEEGKLGRLILERLLHNSPPHTQGNLCFEKHEDVKKTFDSLLHDAFDENHVESPYITNLRHEWSLGARSSIYSPPYKEVPHMFMYQKPLADRYYISLDLKSADFHVLHLAVPTLFNGENNWDEWVRSTIPSIVEKLPFISELKPLRVRTLGKVLHCKNVSLQSFCLRLIVRLLLVMAESLREVFASVSRVFHFSCDELIVQLQEGCSLRDARILTVEISSLISSLNWESLLPIRVELLELNLNLLPTQMSDTDDVDVCDEEKGVTKLYRGHSILRTSGQFVDLPSALDPTWEEPLLPSISDSESCKDGFFTRTVYSIHDHHAVDKVQFKKLSNSFRPRILMNYLHSKSVSVQDEKKHVSLSASAKAFIAAAKSVPSLDSSQTQTQTVKSSLLSKAAQEFVPGNHTGLVNDGISISSAVNAKVFVPSRSQSIRVELSAESTRSKELTLSYKASEFVPSNFSSFKNGKNASMTTISLSSDAPEFVPSLSLYERNGLIDETGDSNVFGFDDTYADYFTPTFFSELTGSSVSDGEIEIVSMSDFDYSDVHEPIAPFRSSSSIGDYNIAGNTLHLSSAAKEFVPCWGGQDYNYVSVNDDSSSAHFDSKLSCSTVADSCLTSVSMPPEHLGTPSSTTDEKKPVSLSASAKAFIAAAKSFPCLDSSQTQTQTVKSSLLSKAAQEFVPGNHTGLVDDGISISSAVNAKVFVPSRSQSIRVELSAESTRSKELTLSYKASEFVPSNFSSLS